MSDKPEKSKGKPDNKASNNKQNSRGSRSMSDLAGGNANSAKKKPIIPRGRGRGGNNRGGTHNYQPQGNPPSYTDAVSYTGQNTNYGYPQMPQNPPMYPNQMYGGGAPPNYGYIPPSLASVMENSSQRPPLFPPPYQQAQQPYQQAQQPYQQVQQPYQQAQQPYQQAQQPYQQAQQPYHQGQQHQQGPNYGQKFQQKDQNQFNQQPRRPNNDRPQNKAPALTAKDVIRELVTFSGFWTELDTLSKRLHRDYKDTRAVLNKYRGIFNTKNEDSTGKLLVELSPKIKFCGEYIEESGCHKERCFAIHTCQYNLFGSCSENACPFGHNLSTNHNNNIFKNFELDEVETNKLKELLKVMIKGSVYPKICVSYHQQISECKHGKGCKQLHVCYDYVSSLGNCSKGDDCPLNHNIHDPGCIRIFNRFNISTNESPRDLLKLLVKHMQQNDDDSQWEMGSSKTYEVEKKDSATRPKESRRKEDKYIDDVKSKLQNIDLSDGGSTDDDDDDQESDSAISSTSAGAKKKKAKKRNKNKKENIQTQGVGPIMATKNKKENIQSQGEGPTKAIESLTFFASNLKGNVASSFICLPFLYRDCKDMKTGCKYLHTKNTFHWQFGDKNWFNFHFYHVKIIERHFRDVSSDGCVLPPLDHTKLDRSMKDMPCLIGSKPVKVDFTTMTLSGELIKTPWKLRHITTFSSAVSGDKYSTVFKWYFKNEKDKWQVYEVSGKSVIASEDIEKAYLKAPNDPFFFQTNSFVYELNFTNMTQMNKSTKTIREIRRRPQDFPTSDAAMVEKVSLPSNWDTTVSNKDYNLVPLSTANSEYPEVRQIVSLTLFCSIEGIMRIQNEHLWRQFGNKKNELKAKYKQDFLNVQKLFHCIDDKHFLEVCQENLDWRVHDNSIHKQFGQGAYFFNSAATASKFCVPDHLGIKKLLVFDVIIGYITKGDQAMTRPPENPASNSLYDTTVDDETSPTTFVKYNKQEYYPAYVVQFK